MQQNKKETTHLSLSFALYSMMRRPASCWSGDTLGSPPLSPVVLRRVYRRPSESHRTFLKRASSEYCIASVVRHHPHIVGALDLLMEDYHFCMVLALTEMGSPLSRTTIPTGTLLTQLTNALEYLHSLGIAHCNIQPNTILVFPCGTVKLTGFGDAHVFCPPFQTAHIPLSTTKSVGQLAYQAPEVLGVWHHAHTHSLTAAAAVAAAPVDMWALGVVVFAHAQGGRLPWSVACPRHDTQYAQFLNDPPLASLIHHLLNPDPATRITSLQLSAHLSSNQIPSSSLFSILD